MTKEGLSVQGMGCIITDSKGSPKCLELRGFSLKDGGQTYDQQLAMAWGLQGLGKLATRLLELIAFLGRSVPEKIILPTALNADAWAEEAAEHPRPAGAYTRALADLLEISVVSQNSEDSSLHIHDLTQDVVKSLMPHDRFHTTILFATKLVDYALQRQDLAVAKSRPGVALLNVFVRPAHSSLSSKVRLDLARLAKRCADYHMHRTGDLVSAWWNYRTAQEIFEEHPEQAVTDLTEVLACTPLLIPSPVRPAAGTPSYRETVTKVSKEVSKDGVDGTVGATDKEGQGLEPPKETTGDH